MLKLVRKVELISKRESLICKAMKDLKKLESQIDKKQAQPGSNRDTTRRQISKKERLRSHWSSQSQQRNRKNDILLI